MNESTANPAASLQRHCVLAYAGQLPAETQSGEGISIVAIFSTSRSVSRILLDPGWKSVVSESQWPYFEDLFLDWKQRLAANPEALFQHLSSLSAGPLITAYSGPHPPGGFAINELLSAFQEI